MRQVGQVRPSSGVPQTKQIEYGARRELVGAGTPGSGPGSGGGGATTGIGASAIGGGGAGSPGGAGGPGSAAEGGAGVVAASGPPPPASSDPDSLSGRGAASGGVGAGSASDGASGGGCGAGAGEAGSFSRRSRRKNDAIARTAVRPFLALPGATPHPFSARRAPAGMAPSPSERLRTLGIELPPPPSPKGSYVPVVVHGGFAFVAGQIVTGAQGVVDPGRVDREVSAEAARALARRATLQAVSALAEALGSIDRVRRIVRVGVFVASSDGFVRQHEVANGATDLLVEIWGDAGRPARVAVGVPALPLNAPVEVELVAAVE